RDGAENELILQHSGPERQRVLDVMQPGPLEIHSQENLGKEKTFREVDNNVSLRTVNRIEHPEPRRRAITATNFTDNPGSIEVRKALENMSEVAEEDITDEPAANLHERVWPRARGVTH